MGWGDEIMVTAEARALQQKDPRKVAVPSKRFASAWHPIWQFNPRMAHPDELTGVQWLQNYSGHRPYIDYAKSTRERWAWKPYRCEPGEIYLTDDERAIGAEIAGAVIIEPNIKAGAPRTKIWGRGTERWESLADLLRGRGFDLVQIGPRGAVEMRGVRRVFTANVREAAAAVSGARAVVTPEGGLHHCAAAFGVPAVVIRGGYIGPQVTGYAGQADLFVASEEWPLGCGARFSCAHCAAAMEAITPKKVSLALRELLNERKSA